MTGISLKRHTVRDILLMHTERYPMITPCDAVKLIYQSVFGPGHLISDPASALEYLEREMSSVSAVPFPLTEEIGGGFSRMYLSDIDGLTHEESVRLIGKMFLCSADNLYGSDELFVSQLDELRSASLQGIIPFSLRELDEYLASFSAGGIRPVSHSEIYKSAYHPAYRVVRSEYATLLPIIIDLISKGSGIIAIDGYCASGKSTIARSLASVLDANLIHMDDFFLPPEKRTEERYSEPGGNVDYERFKAEVADHLNDEVFEYGVFDCSVMKISSTVSISRRDFTIIEGSYSMHPYFGDYADITIFVETSSDEQIERIRKRDGDRYLSMFTERWIPFEKKYESAYGIRRRADYLIET